MRPVHCGLRNIGKIGERAPDSIVPSSS
jgi:hypothetical protein